MLGTHRHEPRRWPVSYGAHAHATSRLPLIEAGLEAAREIEVKTRGLLAKGGGTRGGGGEAIQRRPSHGSRVKRAAGSGGALRQPSQTAAGSGGALR